MPTNGRIGGRNTVSVSSFPGIEADSWKFMIEEQTYYNWGVVYKTDVEEHPELAKLIKNTDWQKDNAKWNEVVTLLKGEEWFQQWETNVDAEVNDGKELVAITSPKVRGGFGNYQRAEIKYMKEVKGYKVSIRTIEKLRNVNQWIKVQKPAHVSLAWPVIRS